MTHNASFTISTRPGVASSEVQRWIMDVIMKGLQTDTAPLGNVGVPQVTSDEIGNLPIIETIRMTMAACPTLWSGRTVDGREVFIRYRFGHLTAQIGQITKSSYGEFLYAQTSGSELDSAMDTAEMIELLSGVLNFSQVAF